MLYPNFFRINMPYGIKLNSNGEAMVFNRLYKPVGISDITFDDHDKTELPVYTYYKGLTEKLLLEVADGGQIDRYDNGKIRTVWFYNDATNPTVDGTKWNTYLKKIKLLSKLSQKPSK